MRTSSPLDGPAAGTPSMKSQRPLERRDLLTYHRVWHSSASTSQVMREGAHIKARTLQLKRRRLKQRAAEQRGAADSDDRFFLATVPDPFMLGQLNLITVKRHSKSLYCHRPANRKSSLWQPQCSFPCALGGVPVSFEKPPFLAVFPKWLLM